MNRTTRRAFLQSSMAAGAAAGFAFSQRPAHSAPGVLGANERINLGLIGCGGRGRWILQNMVKPANANVSLAAACDIWTKRQETYPGEAEKLFGQQPKMYADYRKLLENPDVDAVIIATPAHQHCGQTIDAVEAGKHVYVEKPIAPIARDLPMLNRCFDAVKESKCVVQHGSQGVSGPGAIAMRDLVQARKLGKVFRVESTQSLPTPYWINYTGPKSAEETDWQAFLYNREDRPFDAHMHASWMGYHDFSSGAIGGWMAHFINMVHFVTGCDAPTSATAFGGRYAPTNDPRCDAPDQVTVVCEYGDGFYTQFNSYFGSEIDSESTLFMCEKGVVRSRFGHDVGNPTYSSEGVDDEIEEQKLLEERPEYPGQAHVENWFQCIREGAEPAANMDYGYKQGIAVILGDLAYQTGCKVIFDQKTREVKKA